MCGFTQDDVYVRGVVADALHRILRRPSSDFGFEAPDHLPEHNCPGIG